jgi:hypothetical protein
MRFGLHTHSWRQKAVIGCIQFFIAFHLLIPPLYGSDQEIFEADRWNDLNRECIDGNCVDGNGTMLLYSTQKYIGEFKNGQRHGQGTLYLPLERVLEGRWRNDELVEGTANFSDGARYTGTWEFGYRHGKGELIYPDGRKYSGEFHGGNRHGQGIMRYPDGRVYQGEFKNGTRTGTGTMTYPGGLIKTGQFLDGEYMGPDENSTDKSQ